MKGSKKVQVKFGMLVELSKCSEGLGKSEGCSMATNLVI